MQFEYLEHTADLKFRAFGESKEKLLENSAKALCNAIIDLKQIEKKSKEIIEVKAENFEELLFQFLKELLFQIDSKELIFSEFKVIELKEKNKEKKFQLKVSCSGEKIDLDKHELKTEIKAITKHGFKVEKKKKWITEVLVDV
jgi:SHS2 domain-containing protein